jgi:hypothetical protein
MAAIGNFKVESTRTYLAGNSVASQVDLVSVDSVETTNPVPQTRISIMNADQSLATTLNVGDVYVVELSKIKK